MRVNKGIGAGEEFGVVITDFTQAVTKRTITAMAV
jgi:hypothetical protein